MRRMKRDRWTALRSTGTRSTRTRSTRFRNLVFAACTAVLLASTPALANDDYDPESAGHPLRIAAYVTYPVGFVLDWLIFRPAHWIGSYEPFRSVFGRSETP